MGKEVTMKKDLELRPDDINDKDILITLGKFCKIILLWLGGDGTYLRCASVIKSRNIPILGINTDPSRSIGHLCNAKIYNDKKEDELEKIFNNLDRENFDYFFR